MMRLCALFIVAFGYATFCPPVSAHTNPEDVARRCVARVNEIVDRCENAARQETQDCLEAIRRYLAAGRRDLAIQTARECIRAAETRTEHCVRAVREVCTECIDWLLLHGADDLAARVRNVCADAIDHLERLLRRQTNAILDALNG